MLPRPFILPVYKPPTMTSTAVVSFFKKKFPSKEFGKIGHFGTLDPFAEGVLLLGFASALKLSGYVNQFMPKSYLAGGTLGVATDSGDSTGEIIEKKDCPKELQGDLQGELLRELQGKFRGEYLQKPHPFSASKHKGKPLYKYARQGVHISKSAVKRYIYALEDIFYDPPQLKFHCTVSGGTYIRTLFEDIAGTLGTVGHLTKLVRTEIGGITSKQALKREQWDLSAKDVLARSLSLDEFFPLDTLPLSEVDGLRYRQGQEIACNSYVKGKNTVSGEYCWVFQGRELLGMGQKTDLGPRVCFNLAC